MNIFAIHASSSPVPIQTPVTKTPKIQNVASSLQEVSGLEITSTFVEHFMFKISFFFLGFDGYK